MVNIIITAIITAIVTLSIERIFNNFPKIKNTIKLAIQVQRKKHMIEKGTEWSGGFPIFKSPKGYLYTVSDVQKSLYCADCYKPDLKLIRLIKTGRKKYICPACKKEYKA